MRECAVIQKTTRLIVAAVVLVLSPLASVAGAQGTTATIVGTITDSSGGALPGHPRHRAQRRHRPGPQRACRRRRRLSPRVPADRQLRRGGRPRRVQDGAPQRHRPARLRHGAGGRRPGARRARRDGDRERRRAAGQHQHRRNRADHRSRGHRRIAAGRPQRLLAAGSDARRAIQQQRRVGRIDRHQLARARLPRAAHVDQRRRRRRHRLGELLPRWRHQHDRAAQHRQHPAQPGRHPGGQGSNQQLQRGVRPFRQRRHQRGHQVGDEPVPRLALRFPPRRAVQRQGLGIARWTRRRWTANSSAASSAGRSSATRHSSSPRTPGCARPPAPS